MHSSEFVRDLALVLCVGALTSVLARLLRQSTVLGYLLAGLIVGPYIPIPVFADPERVQALAEFGVVLVMFAVGLEFRLKRLVAVLPTSGFTGVVQVGFLTWCGYSLGSVLGWERVPSLFLGACIAISSTMVVTRVFDQVKVAGDVREKVLGVLVVQDVLAIVLIAAMTSVAAGGGLAVADLAATLGRLTGVLLLLCAGGLLVVPRLVRLVAKLGSEEILAVVSVGTAFGLALLADRLGYSVALGAFLAGMFVAQSGRARRVEPLLHPLRDVFAAVFFVSIGMAVDPRIAREHLPTSLLVSAVVIAAQLFIISVASVLSGLGLRRSLSAGLALGQIGEFAFILAAIGIGAGVVGPELSSILVTVAMLTAFTTPLLLARADRFVHAVDRRLPARLQHLLCLYESWLDRYRAAQADPHGRTPSRRLMRALGLDALGLLVLVAAGLSGSRELAEWLGQRAGLSTAVSRAVVLAAGAILALPLLVGAVRNALALARGLGSSVVGDIANPTPAARIAERTSRLLAVLAVLLAIGIPSSAVLRPMMSGTYSMGLLLLCVLALGAYVWRNAGAIESEYRSGAEQIADLIERGGAGDEPATGIEHELLPGMESARTCLLPLRSTAVGHTLAELDLRARSGATVVAIQRRGERHLLPTGHEHLEAGDVLALVGSRESVASALSILMEVS